MEYREEEVKLKMLEYFFECYFNVSANFYELEALVKEYIKIENDIYVQNFKDEVEIIVHERNWQIIIDIGLLKGGRIFNTSKAEIFIKYIKSLLCNEQWYEKPDFYSM